MFGKQLWRQRAPKLYTITRWQVIMYSKFKVTLTGILLKAYDYVVNGNSALNERT